MDWSTILVSVLSFIGTLAGSYSGMKLMTYRIEQLEKKVNEHNNVIRRTYILEEQMKVVNHRVDDLERHEEEREHE
jgi:ATP-dependent Lon protease